MISILLSTPGVAAHRLQMPIGIRTEIYRKVSPVPMRRIPGM
jgi:hypothetical protein